MISSNGHTAVLEAVEALLMTGPWYAPHISTHHRQEARHASGGDGGGGDGRSGNGAEIKMQVEETEDVAVLVTEM